MGLSGRAAGAQASLEKVSKVRPRICCLGGNGEHLRFMGRGTAEFSGGRAIFQSGE